MVTDTLASTPELAVLVAILMRAGLAWQRSLSWPEYRTLHGLKRRVFPVLDRLEPFGFTSFVNPKRGRTDAEYLTTVRGDYRGVVTTLRNGGGSLHLISSVKRRPDDHGDPYSAAHLVWTHDDGSQTEAFLFENDDGSTDVYVHAETSVTDPDGHLSDPQTDGDPRGVVTDALGL